MAWYTSSPEYFTDSGALSSRVTHAQADAMVAAAARVWNVPTASLTLAQGGQLAEHVSSANAYFNGTNVVFPADVQASNYAAIQIAVIYDTNGSVTNLLLGGGANELDGCLENGVTESVDQFGSDATIQHAVIVLNGLCVGSNAQQLTQMQYQLTRAFGRVLGLAWSQLNDGVFTGAVPFTTAEMALWPLMHPIDVMCGLYTYQCMTNPFTLRPDDVSALVGLYPVNATGSGKTQSSYGSVSAAGTVSFPTGQGMEGVVVSVIRQEVGAESSFEPYPVVSSTTGYQFQQNGGNPVTGAEVAALSGGVNDPGVEGGWSVANIAAPTGTDVLGFVTSSINPLYTGEYAVGPYQRPVIAMSGSSTTTSTPSVIMGNSATQGIAQGFGAASSCDTGGDGTEASPAAANATGLWSGLLCSTGHTSWWETAVNANTSWTIEMTAMNETGAATVQKAQPVIGVWNEGDPTGTLPTVAVEPVAMNSLVLGMTQLRVPASGSTGAMRIGVADQFGAGRPDFAYAARILYASAISPAVLSTGGGQVTISGMGFRTGNQVTINGVVATVLSLTSTQIVAMAPVMSAAGATSGMGVDVVVTDPATAGSTDMQGALTYVQGTSRQVKLVSAPASLETGFTAATPFAVRVVAADGVTPVANASVTFVVAGSGSAAAIVTGCQTGPGCVVATDATGLAKTPVMGLAAGSVTLSGTEKTSGASAQATIGDADPVRAVTMGGAPQYLAAGAAGSWGIALTATQDGVAAANAPVVWTTAAAGFSVTPPGELTTANGTAAATVRVGAIGGGTTNVVTGCAWSAVCSSFTVYGVAPSQWVIATTSGAGQRGVLGGQALRPVMMQVTDGAGHALPGAAVSLYQTAYAWEGECAAEGACASAPVLGASASSAISDANGMVSVVPQVVAGVAQVLKIAASTGTSGFAVTSLVLAP
jgi:hypothetical protein